ncbi:hypothetical protein D3871_02830 [Noviherbaspirillum saxi]|uniref:Uncharacterized protein n=1 Tax=Noviherbaspirillum saxi TaxID=2320863 RepID=A0A3A3G9N3_9BURK|nr:hypothetical protein D3871_02830 [Noviherbaspirillum saxi]
MANKALAQRQKMTIRVEPSQRPLKGRNAVVPGAKQKASQPTGSVQASLLSRILGKSDRK